jgi:hypothetical protein
VFLLTQYDIEQKHFAPEMQARSVQPPGAGTKVVSSLLSTFLARILRLQQTKGDIMKVIAVTPAGRRRYLELLAKYVLSDEAVAEWHLWDNCRDPADRAYLQSLTDNRIKIVSLPNSKGDNRSINKFYRTMTDPDAFYVKLDDDICYLPPGFFGRFAAKATASTTKPIWFSPVVINNAICSWLLSFHGKIRYAQPLSCLAACEIGWKNPEFAVLLHRFFLNKLEADQMASLHIPDATMTMGRFSINCLGVFGKDRDALGDDFVRLMLMTRNIFPHSSPCGQKDPDKSSVTRSSPTSAITRRNARSWRPIFSRDIINSRLCRSARRTFPVPRSWRPSRAPHNHAVCPGAACFRRRDPTSNRNILRPGRGLAAFNHQLPRAGRSRRCQA